MPEGLYRFTRTERKFKLLLVDWCVPWQGTAPYTNE
jgi:hypothetical protein